MHNWHGSIDRVAEHAVQAVHKTVKGLDGQ